MRKSVFRSAVCSFGYHGVIRLRCFDKFRHCDCDLLLVDREFTTYADFCKVRDSLDDFVSSVRHDNFLFHCSFVPMSYYRKELAMAKMRYAQSRGVSRRQFRRTAVKTPAVNVAPPKRGGIRL